MWDTRCYLLGVRYGYGYGYVYRYKSIYTLGIGKDRGKGTLQVMEQIQFKINFHCYFALFPKLLIFN